MTHFASFEDYALHPSVVDALAARRLTRPTPLQNNALPLILGGRQTIVLASDGAGRTLAYGAAVLSLFDTAPQVQVCVLVATKRRAQRVEDSLRILNRDNLLRVAQVLEPVALPAADVWIATPTVAAALPTGVLAGLRMVVVDDADDIVQAGLLPQLNDFLKALPEGRQLVLFCKSWPAILDGLRTRYFSQAAVLKQTDSQDSLVSNHPFVLPPIAKPARVPETPKRQNRRGQGDQRRSEGRQHRFERDAHPSVIDDDMLDLSPRRARGGTGPLAPLPRLVTTWQTHRVRVEPGTRHTRDSAHAYLAQRTGIARSALRAIQVSPDSISVDVESREVERFKTAFRDDLLG